MKITERLIDAKLRGHITPEEYDKQISKKLPRHTRITVDVKEEGENRLPKKKTKEVGVSLVE